MLGLDDGLSQATWWLATCNQQTEGEIVTQYLRSSGLAQWNRVADDITVPKTTLGRDSRVQGIYYKYLLSYEMLG